MDTIIHKIQAETHKFNDLYLNCIVLCKSEYYAIVNYSSKNIYSEADKSVIKDLTRKFIPENIKIKEINYSKIYCDEEILCNEIRNITSRDYPSLNSAISNIKSVKNADNFEVFIDSDETVKNYILSNSVTIRLTEYLADKFKDVFVINFNFIISENIKKDSYISSSVVVSATVAESQRFIEVFNCAPLIGKPSGNVAEYIADCEKEKPVILICGKVKNFTEKLTKNEKTLISFVLEDFTGSIFCLMFPGSANVEKVRKITDGSEIIVQGELVTDTYRNCLICKIRYISFCELPPNFILKEKISRPEPENYSIVIPKKLELTSQSDIFQTAGKKVSDFFLNKNFVVFDIETTGLNYDIDRITEIGAIKIENGIISQSFSMLINPQVHIKDETVKLNGIDDELVKNSPFIDDVLPDFYKFTRGCLLVAQNIDFDLKFIKFNAKKIGYYFENTFYDTLQIAREKLARKGLSNFKLDTLCSYFNIELKDHHRAWNDALATAKLFIELIDFQDINNNI